MNEAEQVTHDRCDSSALAGRRFTLLGCYVLDNPGELMKKKVKFFGPALYLFDFHSPLLFTPSYGVYKVKHDYAYSP